MCLPYIIIIYNCTTTKANTTSPNPYHNLYYSHWALDNCHQVLGCIKYLQFQHSIATIVVIVVDETIEF